MSVEYLFYAEVKTKDKWIGLLPIIKTADGKYKVTELMWGQSAFSDFYDELCEGNSARCGLPSDISSDLQEIFHSPDEKTESFWGREITWGEYYENCVHSVNYSEAIRNKIIRDRPYKYQGYVDKRSIAAFEVGDENGICSWLTKDEYEDLPKEEKLDYTWYEWNEWGDVYGLRYELYRKVEALLGWYRDAVSYSKDEYDYDDFVGSNVRIIIHRC